MQGNHRMMAWKTSLLHLLVSAAFAQTPTPGPGQGFPTADANGAWTFFTDPRALYYKGQRERLPGIHHAAGHQPGVVLRLCDRRRRHGQFACRL